MGGYVLIYLGALGALFIAAFWALDPLSGEVVHTWGLGNFRTLWHEHTYWRIAGRTIGLAGAVTVTDIVIAFPFAYFMARVASPRTRTVLFVLVLLPLWSSYLARIYAWRLILSKDGALNWWLGGLGLPEQHIAYTNWAMWIVFSYIWLPFMILPVYAALERIPDSYIEASGDLGAKNWTTFRRVVLPLALPGVVAGSIFTFSLTLGDYITPILVGNTAVHRQRRLSQRPRPDLQPALRGGLRDDSARRDGDLPRRGAPRPARSRRSDERTRRAARARRVVAAGDRSSSGCRSLIILVYAFNTSNIQSWPIPGFTLKWFRVAWQDQEARTALMLSLKAGARRDGGRARARDDGCASRSRGSGSSGAKRSRSCSCCRSRFQV